MRALRVVGASGAGKTALAETIAAEACAHGWLVVTAPSFRIHAGLPLFVARRIVQTLLEVLGEQAGRYSSGLTIDRDHPEDFREAFLRIIEGVTLDHHLLLILDDAQWSDAESRALIEQTVTALADRAIVVLATERSDESSEPTFSLADEAIALADLPLEAAVEIVRSIYPGVNDDVATGIAAETHGRASDIVAVATAARESRAKTLRDVSASTRRVVARDLALLDGKLRLFLQLCALIDEPIDLALLQQLLPRDELFAMIDQASGRYLISGPDGLRFIHATVMESVRETIPIEIPLRHRIVDALRKLPSPRLEDLERIAKQSAASGDRDSEREALVRLSDEAASQSLLTLSASALERALAIASPAPNEIAATYGRLSQMYNGLGRETDAIRIARRGLSEAEAAGISDGIGTLAASIALAQANSGLEREARATISRYARIVASDAERASLFSIGEIAAMHRVDVAGAREYHAEYERYGESANAVAALRHHVANAFLALRLGDEPAALECIKQADRALESAPSMFAMMPLAVKIYHVFRYRGVAATEALIAEVGQGAKLSPVLAIQGEIMIARGDHRDLDEYVAEKLSSSDSSMRSHYLNMRYTAAALSGLPGDNPIWQLARADIATFEAGERVPTVLPIVAASLLPLAKQSASRARKLLADALVAAQSPLDVTVFFCPLLLAETAKILGAKDALETIASGALWTDEQPWNRAQHTLACGIASAALELSEREALLTDARDRFITLGGTHFAELASNALGKHKAAREGARPNNTTRREFEIAALVADGLTNREIAERLVLSERTVEGHVANLFAKVNVNSRTQLATWYMRSSFAASSR